MFELVIVIILGANTMSAQVSTHTVPFSTEAGCHEAAKVNYKAFYSENKINESHVLHVCQKAIKVGV